MANDHFIICLWQMATLLKMADGHLIISLWQMATLLKWQMATLLFVYGKWPLSKMADGHSYFYGQWPQGVIQSYLLWQI